MKTLRLISVSILFAALCLAFTACNQSMTAGNGTGEVRIVIGGGAARSVDPANGLPVFDESNTTITVTDENGTQLAQGTTSVTLQVAAGKKIKIEAVVTTATGEWRGSAEHTVTEGTNTVAVKLSKAPKGVAGLLFSITGTHPTGARIVSLSMQNGKKLLDGILIADFKPITARDKIGRVYVLYEDTSASPQIHLTRFDVEGKEDAGFEAAVTNALPSRVGITDINNMAIDAKNNNLFLFYTDYSTGYSPYPANVVCINETTPNTFTCSASVDMHDLDPSISDISAAAYNGTLFFTVPIYTGPTVYKLFACKTELSDTTLRLRKVGEPQSINQLRTDLNFGNHNTECTGLFADESGVYCLLARKADYNHHAVGMLIRYEYSDSGLTQKAETGLNSNDLKPGDFLTVDADSFSYPIGFIGSDKENIYIADDGANIEYRNENWRVDGNKNRIAAFNRKTENLTFSDTDATWYVEFSKYKKPNTKVLLWKKTGNSMSYWTSTDGTEAFSGENALFESSLPPTIINPTDKFCYDQDGNLYILWEDDLNRHKVSRFILQDNGFLAFGYMTLLSAGTSAIAVDISDGKNYLYYWDDAAKLIKRYSWDTSFPYGSFQTYSIAPTTSTNETVTALAANKDGVFVAVQEKYKDGTIDKYRLKVQKYPKTDGNYTTPPGSQIILEDVVSYTDVTTEVPIACPSLNLNHEPNTPCHQYEGRINGLQIGNGKLYGISSKLHREWKANAMGTVVTDVFKHSSKVYEIGDTAADQWPPRPSFVKEKPVDDEKKVSYGFYRFIAVKYDEQERIKFIIASDSAWGESGATNSPNGANTDRIVEFNLTADPFKENKNKDTPSRSIFSKFLNNSSFVWE